ncbi:MAG: OsmC family protein [Bryobacterales bacterium]|nr:OsmC family protein [Bryobacterales bacterium]
MPARTGTAEWKGNLTDGKGTMSLGSGAYSGPYDWRSRSGDGAGTNPEELIAAAHAGCFSMALSAAMGQEGITPERIATTAKAHLEKGEGGFSISKIELSTEVTAPGLAEDKFQALAAGAKANCPVSKALAGTTITLTAKLV